MLARIFVLAVGAVALAMGPSPALQEPAAEFVCPPCGVDCHDRIWPRPGVCGGCGMELVPLSSVTRVQVFLYEGVDLYSAGALLALFTSSDCALVASVADTHDALRCGGVSLVARHTFDDAPATQVLVVPDYPNALEVLDDELALAWLRIAGERAEHVLAVGRGCVLLAAAGLLDGLEVPVEAGVARRLAALAPEAVLRDDVDRTRDERFLLARDAGAGLELALELVTRIGDEPAARRVAERFGLAMPIVEER